MIVGEMCVIDISLNNETAEEAGVYERTHHHWRNHGVYIEWREHVPWGSQDAGIGDVHDLVC
jgi:hypothetical protein